MKYIGMFINFVYGLFCGPVLKPVTGQFYGKVGYDPAPYEVWYYTPSCNALVYKTFNGSWIIPGPMITDGVSVPQWLGYLGYETLSSKYFLKAALIHDWLFDAVERETPIIIGYKSDGKELYSNEISFTRANEIFAEAIRTEMKERGETVDEDVIAIFFNAVEKFGREAWDTPGFVEQKKQLALAQKEGRL